MSVQLKLQHYYLSQRTTCIQIHTNKVLRNCILLETNCIFSCRYTKACLMAEILYQLCQPLPIVTMTWKTCDWKVVTHTVWQRASKHNVIRSWWSYLWPTVWEILQSRPAVSPYTYSKQQTATVKKVSPYERSHFNDGTSKPFCMGCIYPAVASLQRISNNNIPSIFFAAKALQS